ncbi:MAG: hypothetical protein Q8880_02600 [Bacteroidota bacterium]|nr:hypothetical protein [Bacteroidota bacterium]
MKKVLFTLAIIGVISLSGMKSFGQATTLNDQQFSYITMDLQGILKLTMTTNPQVDFVFSTIQQYKQGINKFNAVGLWVDATVAWDLYAYPTSDYWTLIESYSTNGVSTNIPSEILQIQAVNGLGQTANPCVGSNFNTFTSLWGSANNGNTSMAWNSVNANTQFVAGAFGTGANQQMNPGTAKNNPSTNQFRLHYSLKPGIPAAFSDALGSLTAPMALPLLPSGEAGFVQPGYYSLEVAYCLTEDL